MATWIFTPPKFEGMNFSDINFNLSFFSPSFSIFIMRILRLVLSRFFELTKSWIQPIFISFLAGIFFEFFLSFFIAFLSFSFFFSTLLFHAFISCAKKSKEMNVNATLAS